MQRPAVLPYYNAFCAAMVLLYVFTVGLGVFLLAIASDLQGSDKEDVIISGIACIITGIPLAIGYAIVPFLRRSRNAWYAGVAAIGLSCSSCCCMPVGIPLLIYWLKPETKAYFEL